MEIIKPFICVRPEEQIADQVAALPYDVYDRKEAYAAVAGSPLSFLNIDRPDTQFPPDVDMYADCVYEKARELLERWIEEGIFVTEKKKCLYVYQLVMKGRSQTGIVACSSIDDYRNGVVRRHENTREDKQIDRIRHVDACDAQTGPIFLAYRARDEINWLVELVMKNGDRIYHFTTDDGVGHRVWRIDDEKMIQNFVDAFSRVPYTYIADGHHRAESAVRVGELRRKQHPGYTGEEPFNYFLSVLFPGDQLMIMPYNRVVQDLNGLTEEAFLAAASEHFRVSPTADPVKPERKGVVGLYLPGRWSRLEAKAEILSGDPVAGLDVSILQDRLLGPVLGIQDPKTDRRIRFVGGIRGVHELERRVGQGMAAAFSMYPTSMEELFRVSDAGLLMPPKSTWFEPKLRSGIFIHRLS